ncbi:MULTISPECIES: MerR family DNA-binding transcriptional regulator [unclassified Rhizobacter]|uniref:MerR family DNA-binding transcriptional regulator n=1 Tax=unclassified Rhizobacter TaxID=2640088 RepID=UPI0006F634A5|nr:MULTISPECIES: MerR family DNA-binding transcriptional regulator [unclassified Rhizobacter]KQU65919.1 MerR family transcriptional regulator [Rhizobacter sp. Root29]KQV97940.1 MerR family transcriptional regulator [Rhizobacter sp. Root1238]KRB18674.1 MerR family transcriptional regulator [Rhizobacter sp. Root16D2]
MKPVGLLAIGALSRLTGISVRAIRHYDALKLLKSSRAENGYRKFEPGAAAQVCQIQRLLATGLSLDETRTFPGCMLLIEGAAPCEQTLSTQRERLALIEAQIDDLERRRARLREMLRDHSG